MFNSIMVALDGSDHASHALDLAIGLAKSCNARLVLFHAIMPPPLPGEYSRMADRAARDMYKRIGEESGEQILGEAERRVRDAGIAEVSKVMLEGSPPAAAVEVAEREGTDLIVVGTRGLTGLKELALGSVAHSITSMARCPVLVVK